MRILMTADLHFSLKQFDWLVEASSGYDLVVVAGDLLDLAGHADLDTQIVVVLKYLEKISEKVPIVVSSGNHDGDIKSSDGEFIADWLRLARGHNLHVDGDSLKVDNDLISICPWWDGPVSQEEVRAFLEAESEKSFERWMWVHHAPPDNSPVSWTGKRHFGDAALIDLIERYQPKIVLCGHVHNSPFRPDGSWVDKIGETWVFNPGREMSSYPCYIELDLDAMEAMWNSTMGREQVSLNAPLPERHL